MDPRNQSAKDSSHDPIEFSTHRVSHQSGRSCARGLALIPSVAGAHYTVNLIAAPFTKTVTLPNGSVVAVPMWGFALDLDGDGILDPGETATVPGPRITVPPGETELTINLRNLLPENVSIMIPGQQSSGAPVSLGGRIVSMAPEAAASVGYASYTFANLKPGTYLYHSASHTAVQVQMGLYGAVTRDVATREAYAGVRYNREVLLLYSEIDRALHAAVADGTYGSAGGPTSTIDYAPSLFLVNGNSYTGGLAAINGGAAGRTTLIRMLNAGLRSHVVAVDNATPSLVAEDGNRYLDARTQASILLPAGKTHDALWTPTSAGDYAVYDRTLHLMAEHQGSGRHAGDTARHHSRVGSGADRRGGGRFVRRRRGRDAELFRVPQCLDQRHRRRPDGGALRLAAFGCADAQSERHVQVCSAGELLGLRLVFVSRGQRHRVQRAGPGPYQCRAQAGRPAGIPAGAGCHQRRSQADHVDRPRSRWGPAHILRHATAGQWHGEHCRSRVVGQAQSRSGPISTSRRSPREA